MLGFRSGSRLPPGSAWQPTRLSWTAPGGRSRSVELDRPHRCELVPDEAVGVRGEVVAGQRLPSARELAESLELNVHTVLHAYQQLRDEGLIELRRGRGAIVRAEAVDAGALHESVAALVAEARRRGVPAGMLTALIEEEYR